MKRQSATFVFFGSLAALLMLTGCPPKKKLAIQDKPKEEEQAKKEEPTDQKEAKDVNALSITQEWTEIPALTPVMFGYDSSNLDSAARETLKKNVAVLKKLPTTVTVRVEGHCDERGTIEYNIALGQKRANAVQSYYITAGLGKSRLETVSFGEERPICTQQTEECWSKNRRSVTKVRNTQPITVQASDLE